jgi:hypothetical protein
MIRLDMEQGSPEWIQARLGIPTASQFHRIITPAKLKPSSAQDKYIRELLAEWLLGEPQDDYVSELMERGKQLEDEAVAAYEFENDVSVDRVGFCLRNDESVGASPDGLIGDNGGLEIKCPGAPAHIGYLIGDPENEYKAQIQGGLWVCERDWWSRLSYNPAMPKSHVKCGRDEDFLAALPGIMDGFLEKLKRAKEKMLALGCKPAEPITNESVAKERGLAA